MTKEEILSPHVFLTCDEGEPELYSVVIESKALDAMDEYAEQESIGFSEWIDKEYVKYGVHPMGKYTHKDDTFKEKVMTIKELYLIYKQQNQ